MVSKAAERSRRHRQEFFCEPIALIVNVRERERERCFSGMVFTVGRLMRIEEIVRREDDQLIKILQYVQ